MIHQILRNFGLSFQRVVGFGSDGASTMLGPNSGVAVRLKIRSPSLLPFHCPAHRVDLAIMDVVEDVSPFFVC